MREQKGQDTIIVGDINNPLSSTDKHSEKILTDPRTKQYHG
jgi:hypothetical protein